MKANPFALTIGGLVLLVFGFLLFSFQVRQTEVALVTTFGKPTSTYTQPGWKFRWPWPIQEVLKFDNRIQDFEGKFKESYTADRYNILVTVFAGWKIRDPALFRERFGGSMDSARDSLDGLIESSKNVIVGKHPLADFVSTDPKQLKFDQMEREMLALIAPQARTNYGVTVAFVGIKRVGLPESVTQSVLNYMREERQRVVVTLDAQGQNKASQILSEAELEANKELADARAKVVQIQGEADAAAAQYLDVFKQEPELAILLRKRQALEQVLTNRATLILDQRTPPFDLLDGTPRTAAQDLTNGAALTLDPPPSPFDRSQTTAKDSK